MQHSQLPKTTLFTGTGDGNSCSTDCCSSRSLNMSDPQHRIHDYVMPNADGKHIPRVFHGYGLYAHGFHMMRTCRRHVDSTGICTASTARLTDSTWRMMNGQVTCFPMRVNRRYTAATDDVENLSESTRSVIPVSLGVDDIK